MQSASGSTVIRSSKCDLSATLEGSAPYIVVFWPSRTNFPRRAGLRQWVERFAAIFSVFSLSVDGFNMFTVFFGTFGLTWANKYETWYMITIYNLFSTGLKPSPRLCVVQKFIRPSQLRKWDWCRLMSGDITVLVLRMILHVSSQLTLVTQVLQQVIW